MKIIATIAGLACIFTAAACNRTPAENKADKIEATGENKADMIEEKAYNQAEMVRDNTANQAEAVREGNMAGDGMMTNTANKM